MSRAGALIAKRRQFMLQYLVKRGGQDNERVIVRAMREGGFYTVANEDIETDIDQLVGLGCVICESLDGLRVVTVTPRGEDAAYGRGPIVIGIAHDTWHR